MTTTTESRHARACHGHPRLAFLTAVKTWMASQLGLARVARYEVPEVGHTRLPVTSRAMTWRECRSQLWKAGTLIAAVMAAASCAQPQTPEEFYRGKTINLIIPNAPGGSFDLYARLAAAHLGRFIPGHPAIVAQNMPGAAGMQAANYLTSVAPKD